MFMRGNSALLQCDMQADGDDTVLWMVEINRVEAMEIERVITLSKMSRAEFLKTSAVRYKMIHSMASAFKKASTSRK